MEQPPPLPTTIPNAITPTTFVTACAAYEVDFFNFLLNRGEKREMG